MEKLIIVRHGEYGRDCRLDDTGRAQIKALSEKLKPIVDGATTLILTSTANRARESAEILAAALGVGFEEHNILNTDIEEDCREVMELVQARQGQADILVLVTHFEYTEQLPSYFADIEWGLSYQGAGIRKGKALILDCRQKSISSV